MIGTTSNLDTLESLALRVAGLEKAIRGRWQTYTPSLSSSGTQPTLGGSYLGGYMNHGGWINGAVHIQFDGTGGAGTGQYKISLPIPTIAGWGDAAAGAGSFVVGSGYLYDASTNILQMMTARPATRTTVDMYYDGAGGFVGAAAPWAWGGNADQIGFDFHYAS